MAGVAFGAANADLKVGGSSSISLYPGDSFDLQLYVDPDGSTALNDNWASVAEMKIQCSASDVLDITGPATFLGNVKAYNTPIWKKKVADFALEIPIGDVDTVSTAPIGAPTDEGQQIPYGPYTFSYVYSRVLLATINCKVDENAPENQTFDITPTGIYFYVNDVVNGTGQTIPGVSSGGVTLTVLPEPASMLLLLGAIPFLRRRR
jgi:hypothetical protein